MADAERSRWELKTFVDTLDEFQQMSDNLKQYRCPHCLSRGTLIRHGYLYGYAPLNSDALWITKGLRLLCSNRYRSRGCGRTVSIWLSSVLHRCIISAGQMWEFVKGLLNGERCYSVARRLVIASSVATPYRWKARLERAQFIVRQTLQPHLQPFASHRVLQWPWLQPYDHLKHWKVDDAIQWWQSQFQTSLFPP
jgi:hypothetical protein